MTTTDDTAGELQPGVDASELWQEAELRSVGAPLLRKAQEALGQPVVIHIIGGMQVSGRLNDIDEEDGTLTLLDGTGRFHVALHAIAVLATRG